MPAFDKNSVESIFLISNKEVDEKMTMLVEKYSRYKVWFVRGHKIFFAYFNRAY